MINFRIVLFAIKVDRTLCVIKKVGASYPRYYLD